MSGRLSTENSPWPGQTTAREARLDEVGCQTRVHVFPGLDQLETAVEQWSRAADRESFCSFPIRATSLFRKADRQCRL